MLSQSHLYGGGLHAHIVDAVGSRIAQGELPPGTILSTELLERDHGVSRSVIREVLRTLTGLGMVKPRHRVGTTVLDLSSWKLLDPQVILWRSGGPDSRRQLDELLTLREALEPLAARQTAAGDDGSVGEQMNLHLNRMRAAFNDGKTGEFATADAAFHEALLRGAHNDALSQLVQTLLAALHARYTSHQSFSDDTASSLDRHQDLVDAVTAGDAEAAEAISRALVRAAHIEVLGQ
jgi:DNA-binding FadR family transcriptional regulator